MNPVEQDMVTDISITRKIMEDGTVSYNVVKDRYYAYITSLEV